MVTWARLEAMARTEWAALLATASDANAVQSWAWGEFKRERRWEPERWVARDAGGRIVGCLQALKRSVALGRLIVWVPGGPILGFAPTAAGLIVEIVATWLEEFRRHNRVVYVRFYSHLPASPEAAYSLSRVVRPVALSVNSGFTCLIDLSPSLEELRAAMTAKHRYYVKQSEAAGLDWKFGWSPELARDMVTLHAVMIDAKRLAQTPCDLETMEALERHFVDDIVLLVGYDGGRPVTSCLALTYAGTAFYLLAATSPEGRKTSAATPRPRCRRRRFHRSPASCSARSTSLPSTSAAAGSTAGASRRWAPSLASSRYSTRYQKASSRRHSRSGTAVTSKRSSRCGAAGASSSSAGRSFRMPLTGPPPATYGTSSW